MSRCHPVKSSPTSSWRTIRYRRYWTTAEFLCSRKNPKKRCRKSRYGLWSGRKPTAQPKCCFLLPIEDRKCQARNLLRDSLSLQSAVAGRVTCSPAGIPAKNVSKRWLPPQIRSAFRFLRRRCSTTAAIEAGDLGSRGERRRGDDRVKAHPRDAAVRPGNADCANDYHHDRFCLRREECVTRNRGTLLAARFLAGRASGVFCHSP